VSHLKISEFEIGPMIGVGAAGTVYRARSVANGEPCAVKVLSAGISHESDIGIRFEREMTILEKLKHPNVVAYLGGGRVNGNLFFAMELVDGGNVKQLLKEYNQLPWKQVAYYGIQIGRALQHVHNLGIVHRDLKPGNLYLTENGDIKLGDFGIARDEGEVGLTHEGKTVGTYSYMSPEQITADQFISGKADLYALGCVMYEMLTGRAPFKGANFAQIWDQHLRHDPEPIQETVADCPEWLSGLVMQLLAKKPTDRPFNARAVQGYLMERLGDLNEADRASFCRLEPHQVAAARATLAAGPGGNPYEMAAPALPLDSISWATLGGLLLAIVAIVVAASFLGR